MLNVKIDSRKVVHDDIFVAIRGLNSDGHQYINQAINNGATKVIAEYGEYNVETIIVNDTKEYLINYLYETYKEELKDITFIGVTGTNGKTTSCYLIYKLLNLLGKKTAYLGTIGFYVGDEVTELKNTTPEITDLYSMFLDAKDKGVEVIVMEVSSHALELQRVGKLMFDLVAFTNLTQDHIDFHGTMDNYLKAKQKLFDKVKPNGYAVINGDDPSYKHFLFKHNNNILYGENEDADYKILDYKLDIDKTNFNFNVNNEAYNATIMMPGKYNIYNFLVALIIVNKMGYDISEILKNTDLLTPPPGRMDSIMYNDAVIIIDYAHTPDAVLNVLNSAKACKVGKIITVIGCGGDRDKTKRPIMGDIATRLSDHVVFTNDNPRTEDPKAIMDDIVKDLKTNNFEVIYDRKDAISVAIDMLNPTDMLLILGKGHENYQIMGSEILHHDDKEYARQYIESKK